ncbi:MAG: stalk domain-containing protein [Syntrophomonas sp.]|nr:stalk domain-containing protein [Syntrophomonas sp.]
MQYVFSHDAYAGFPSSTLDGYYNFAYKKRDEAEKSFNMEEQLTGGDYYFNCRLDSNGYCNPNPDIKPSLDGNILSVVCVKYSGESPNYKGVNLLLKIDMETEKVISRESLPLISPVSADQSAITVTINGQKLELSEPPRLQSDESNYLWLIVPVREISNALGASVTWDSATNAATIVKDNQTIILQPGDRKVWENGRQFELATPPQIINNRLQVSLNFLASALGGRVKWDQAASMAQITTSQPVPLPKPERIETAAFATRVAFTSDGRLWLVDGRQTDSPPISLTASGPAEIVGWSSNGEWLAYLQSDPSDEHAGKQYLWVVKADGTGAIQLDERPVYITPSWSPTENLLAYTTQDTQEGYIPDGNLKISSLKTGVVATTSLWPQNSEIIESLAWSPDGQSLAISLPGNEKQPLRIDQITLKGDHTNLLTLGKASKMENEIYTRVATGLKWSPNGRCLAYYLKPNSASISADGVAIQVLNIPQKKTIDLGGGLAYA